MENKPDKSFGLGSADPPYALKQNLAKVKSRAKLAASKVTRDFDWDNNTPDDKYFIELFRTTQNQVIWGANYFSFIVGTTFKAPRRYEYSDFIKKHPVGWIIWDKVNGDSDFSDCELAWTSFDRPTVVFHFMWAGMRQGVSMERGSTMQGNKQKNERRIHPTQKPIELYRWLFLNYVSAGDSVLSTHMGSQSDKIVAYKMGIDFYGCEISAQHYKDGCARFVSETHEGLFSKA